MDRRTFIKTTSATAAGSALTSVPVAAGADRHPAQASDPQNWNIATPSGAFEPLLLEAVESLAATLSQTTGATIQINLNEITDAASPTDEHIFVTRPDFDLDNHPELALLALDHLVTKESFAAWLWLTGGSALLRDAGRTIGQEIFCLTHTGFPGTMQITGQLPAEIDDPAIMTALALSGTPAAIQSKLGRSSERREAARHLSKISLMQQIDDGDHTIVSDPFSRNGTPLLIMIPSRLWHTLDRQQQRTMELAIESTYIRTQAIFGGMSRATRHPSSQTRAALSLRLIHDIRTAAKSVGEDLAARSDDARRIHDSLQANTPDAHRDAMMS